MHSGSPTQHSKTSSEQPQESPTRWIFRLFSWSNYTGTALPEAELTAADFEVLAQPTSDAPVENDTNIEQTSDTPPAVVQPDTGSPNVQTPATPTNASICSSMPPLTSIGSKDSLTNPPDDSHMEDKEEKAEIINESAAATEPTQAPETGRKKGGRKGGKKKRR